MLPVSMKEPKENKNSNTEGKNKKGKKEAQNSMMGANVNVVQKRSIALNQNSNQQTLIS